MSSRLDLHYRDREKASLVQEQIEAQLQIALSELAALQAITPIAPLECDRHDPISWNKQLGAYSRALTDKANAEAAVARKIEPLLDLLIDPDLVSEDRERERLEILERQDARSKIKLEADIARKNANSEAYRESLGKAKKPEPDTKQRDRQTYADALMLKRGQMDPSKAPEDVKAIARGMGWNG